MRETDKSADTRHKYDDMLELPHHVSSTRPPMDILTRAAQFSPFAALTGYEDAIRETARLTEQKVELDENAKAMLDEKLKELQDQVHFQPEIEVTYFVKDSKKQGGKYETLTGCMKKLDLFAREMVMADGQRIAVDDILDIISSSFLKERD